MNLPFPFEVKTSRRSKSIRITIRPTGTVVVTKPWLVPEKAAIAFLIEKQAWVTDALKKVVRTSEKEKPLLWYKGRPYEIVYSVGRWNIDFSDTTVRISAYSPEAAKRSLEHELMTEARSTISQTVKQYSILMGIPYASLRFADQTSRWGSCSSTGTLSFNWRLIMTPPKVLEYVVIHELAHRKQMNHSQKFWDIVERYDPDYREHRRWLKRHEHSLKEYI